MTRTDRETIWFFGTAIALIVAVVLAWWVARSSFEAAAFNRATGGQVSTWDAMFIELRVQDSPK